MAHILISVAEEPVVRLERSKGTSTMSTAWRTSGNRSRNRPSKRWRLGWLGALGVVILVSALWSKGRSRTMPAGPVPDSTGTEVRELALELQSVIRRGRIAEVRGKTDADASVLINGDKIPLVLADGRFVYFLIVPETNFRITITAQNHAGCSKTIRYILEAP